MCANPVSGFLMNCLAVMNTHQATRVNLTLFLVFWGLGLILFGKKDSINYLEMIGSQNSLNYMSLRVRLSENCMNMYFRVDDLGIFKFVLC